MASPAHKPSGAASSVWTTLPRHSAATSSRTRCRHSRCRQTSRHVPDLERNRLSHAYIWVKIRRRQGALATRVVSDAAVAAVLATLDMSAECSRAAVLDRRHHLELTEAHMPGIGSAPVRSMAIKDVCDLQPRAAHRRPASPRVAASPRSVVPTGRVGWLRPGSWYWRRGCKAPWCRVWHGPELFGSREYRHLARGGEWRNCAAACVARRAS